MSASGRLLSVASTSLQHDTYSRQLQQFGRGGPGGQGGPRGPQDRPGGENEREIRNCTDPVTNLQVPCPRNCTGDDDCDFGFYHNCTDPTTNATIPCPKFNCTSGNHTFPCAPGPARNCTNHTTNTVFPCPSFNCTAPNGTVFDNCYPLRRGPDGPFDPSRNETSRNETSGRPDGPRGDRRGDDRRSMQEEDEEVEVMGRGGNGPRRPDDFPGSDRNESRPNGGRNETRRNCTDPATNLPVPCPRNGTDDDFDFHKNCTDPATNTTVPCPVFNCTNGNHTFPCAPGPSRNCTNRTTGVTAPCPSFNCTAPNGTVFTTCYPLGRGRFDDSHPPRNGTSDGPGHHDDRRLQELEEEVEILSKDGRGGRNNSTGSDDRNETRRNCTDPATGLTVPCRNGTDDDDDDFGLHHNCTDPATNATIPCSKFNCSNITVYNCTSGNHTFPCAPGPARNCFNHSSNTTIPCPAFNCTAANGTVFNNCYPLPRGCRDFDNGNRRNGTRSQGVDDLGSNDVSGRSADDVNDGTESTDDSQGRHLLSDLTVSRPALLRSIGNRRRLQ